MALLRVLVLAAGLFAGLAGFARAQELQPVPALSAHLTDTVGLLPEARRAALENRLIQLEQQNGAQVAVLIVATTRPEDVAAYALRVVEAWRLGRKGVDDGLLFVVAKDDRRMRIEVGYGLEGAVPDAVAKQIIADVVAPRFRAGDFPGGVEAGVDAIAARIAGAGLPAPPADGGGAADIGESDFGGMLMLAVIVAIGLGGVLRAIFGRLLGATVASGVVGGGVWMLTGALTIGLIGAVLAFFFVLVAGTGGASRHSGGPWMGGGGGFGGGGGGGWSGGGGGFGGGGASGGW